MKKIIIVILITIILDNSVFYILLTGINKYFGFNKHADILCIGHSHTVLGIDADLLSKLLHKKVVKYAVSGANILDRYWMIQHYISINPDVKIILYDIGARIFDTQGLSSASYTLFLPFLDNQIMNTFLKQEADWQVYYTCKFIKTARFRDQTLNIALRGLLNKCETRKTSSLNIDDYKSYLEREKKRKIKIDPEALQCFKQTVHLLAQKHIKLVLSGLPVTEPLNKIAPEKQKEVFAIFNSIAYRTPGVYFFNYQKFSSNYKLFFDLRHLNEKGKNILTRQIAQDLKKII